MTANEQIEELGVFVHGTLAALHTLAVVYNLRRRNWSDALIHTGAMAYDLISVKRHISALRLPAHNTCDSWCGCYSRLAPESDIYEKYKNDFYSWADKDLGRA